MDTPLLRNHTIEKSVFAIFINVIAALNNLVAGQLKCISSSRYPIYDIHFNIVGLQNLPLKELKFVYLSVLSLYVLVAASYRHSHDAVFKHCMDITDVFHTINLHDTFNEYEMVKINYYLSMGLEILFDGPQHKCKP